MTETMHTPEAQPQYDTPLAAWLAARRHPNPESGNVVMEAAELDRVLAAVFALEHVHNMAMDISALHRAKGEIDTLNYAYRISLLIRQLSDLAEETPLKPFTRQNDTLPLEAPEADSLP